MFIDEKINELNKESLLEMKEYYLRIKELIKYFLDYNKDPLHIQLRNDFEKVLDNIVTLAKTFSFKDSIEITMFCGFLIHVGVLSLNKKYYYDNNVVDINRFFNDKSLCFALKIFSGSGCCRHTACFTNKVLDKFNIKNNIASLEVNEETYDTSAFNLFLYNTSKKIFKGCNHVINYIEDNNFNYFIDITSNNPKIFGACNQYAYSLDNYDLNFPIYSYNYSVWNNGFVDYRKVLPIKKEEASKLINKANTTIRRCANNEDLFERFYYQNKEIYQNINNSYKKIYEKEKRLTLI